MTTLQIKSIVLIIITVLTSTILFAQDNSYTDKEEYFTGQKRHALKINFIGNFFGTTKISYEHITKPGRSLEFKATLIEGGQHSIFGSVGYKFYKKPTFIAPGIQRRNIMEGAYFKPEIFFGKAKKDSIFEGSSESKSALGLVFNLGNQWVINEFIIVDTYLGTGVGNGSNLRGYLGGKGLILTGGLNVGFAF